MSLDLTPGHGDLLGESYWEVVSPWLGGSSMLNTGPAPLSEEDVYSLSQILQADPPLKYYLSRTACLGILRRAKERGKGLPQELKQALMVQAGILALHHERKTSFNSFSAGFSAGAGPSAGSIGYQRELSPTLKASSSGNMMPTVLCLNDQGGSVMEYSENMTGTLRAQEHGHQPLVFENHGIDARYTGPHPVSPTLSCRAGTGGNNLPLALQKQPELYSRKRVDKFQADAIASTESARQHKDATDLICQQSVGPLLIRKLTPLECERLQGFPDHWTDIPNASDSARYKALGNSVAIPCVEYIMRGLAMAAETKA